MYLSLLRLNPQNPLARRDLGDPYAMHQTLTRIAVPGDRLLWRLEVSRYGESPRLLVQTLQKPGWSRILLQEEEPYGELAPDSPKEVRLELERGQRLRFRLYANPTVARNGRRLGLYREEEQLRWLSDRMRRRGAVVRSAIVSRKGKIRLKKEGRTIVLASAQFDGVLEVIDPGNLVKAVELGIGHGKAFGFGLLSLAPYRS